MSLPFHTVPLRLSESRHDPAPLRVIDDAAPHGGSREQVQGLLDSVTRLHELDDLQALWSAAVESAERLCRGCAAALFTVCPESSTLALWAAGPGWRSAERDAPAWLAPLSGALADLVRADTKVAGRLVHHAGAGNPDVAVFPCGTGPDNRCMLMIAWPPGLAARSGDIATLDRLARHLATAARRLEAMGEWRSAADAMRSAQSELVRTHAERAAASLAGGAAHELNNALSVLLGVSECLLAIGGLDATAQADVAEIHSAAGKTARLAQRLSFVARSARSGDAGPVDLEDTVNTAAARLRAAGVSLPLEKVAGKTHAIGPREVWTHPGDLAEAVGALLQLHAESAAGEPARLDTGGSEDVRLVTRAPAQSGSDPDDPWGICYSRSSRWRGPVLSACRRLADAHGWRLTLEPSADGRQHVVLSLPVARADADAPHLA